MKFPRHQVEGRAKERGYSLSEIEPCFIHQYPDGEWEVDVNHPAYPRARPPRIIPRMVKGGQSAPLPAKPVPGKPTKVILSNFQAPGDGVVLSAAIRDLHRAWPGRFITDIRCPWRAVFEHNPNITAIDDGDTDAVRLRAEYPLIHQADSCGLHFLHGFVQDLAKKLDAPFSLSQMKGDIHLSAEELVMPPQVEGDYWIGNFGSKPDFTNKQYSVARYQEIVTRLHGEIQFVQVGEAHHSHTPLDGVVNLVGKTNLRELFRLVYHSKGILTGNSMLMHLAAAVPTKTGRLRPCVIIAGGREPVSWCQYPGHRFLHTMGQLDCCKDRACWKSRVVPLNDGDAKDKSLCLQPVTQTSGQTIPKCMDMISVDDVVAAIRSYGTGKRGGRPVDGLRTLLTKDRVDSIKRLALSVPPGNAAEMGVYKGGILKLLADCVTGDVYGFDTFSGLPLSKDEEPHKAGEFSCSMEEVKNYVSDIPSITLVNGLFPESAKPFADKRFTFVHVDGDLYQSTKDAIQWFWPRMIPGGIMVFDDWNNPHTPGVRRAIEEYGLPVKETTTWQCEATKPHRTMFIACDATMEAGHKIGDMITMAFAARLIAIAEPHDRILLSLNPKHPLNFVFDQFIKDFNVEVIMDDWQVGVQSHHFPEFERRRTERTVNGIGFDTYKELYRRLEGGGRQGTLCGGERGLGRLNIFEYYFFGQEKTPDVCPDRTFGPPDFGFSWKPEADPMSAFVAPHAVCQGNGVFTMEFWRNVIDRLISAGVKVTVNTDRSGMFGEHPALTYSWGRNGFRALFEQISRQRLVLCGNTGIGWIAGACGVPLIAGEPPSFSMMDYRYREARVRSVVNIFDKPDSEAVAGMALAELQRQQTPPPPPARQSCCGGGRKATVTDMVVNAAGAAVRVVSAAVKGEDVLVPSETAQARLSLCMVCEHLHAPNVLQCKLCGCWVKAKTKLATEKCPEGKW